MKVAIIETRVVLPACFSPRTLTYRAYSQLEKDSEKAYVLKRAEEVFTGDVLKNGAALGLEKSILKVKSSIKTHHIHAYIPTENQIRIKFEKSHEQA
jgi:hypothetical protein